MSDSRRWAEAARSSSGIEEACLQKERNKEQEEKKKEQEKIIEISRVIQHLSAFMKLEFPKAKEMLEVIKSIEDNECLKSLELNSIVEVIEESDISYHPHIYLMPQGFGYTELTLPIEGGPYGFWGKLKEMFSGKFYFKEIPIQEIVRLWSERRAPSELLPYIRQELNKKAESLEKARNFASAIH